MKKGKHEISNNELLHKLVDDFDAEHVAAAYHADT